jgi:hypothetical protein
MFDFLNDSDFGDKLVGYACLVIFGIMIGVYI